MSAGDAELVEVMKAVDDPAVGAIHLLWVLESRPGARKVDTRRQLAALGLPERVPLADLTPQQVDEVLSAFGRDTGTEGESGGIVVVVSGPGGVGKGTVVEQLLARDHRLYLNRSWTTRSPRPGESPDAYHFVTREEFEQRVAAGGFLEWVEFLDYLQGSPVPEPPPGDDVLFEIDVQGAARIKELYPDALLVFIDTPDRAEQEARLRSRGDDEQRVRQRLAKAEEEVARAAELPCRVVINDDLPRAVAEVHRMIEEARVTTRKGPGR